MKKYENGHDKWVKYLKPRYHSNPDIRKAIHDRKKQWLVKLKNNPEAYRKYREYRNEYLRKYRKIHPQKNY